MFVHNAERVLMMLSRGFGDGLSQMEDTLLPCELPPMLIRPAVEILCL
jgi:hypothetical protein